MNSPLVEFFSAQQASSCLEGKKIKGEAGSYCIQGTEIACRKRKNVNTKSKALKHPWVLETGFVSWG